MCNPRKSTRSWPLAAVTFQFLVFCELLCSPRRQHQAVLGRPGGWREHHLPSCQVVRSWFARSPQAFPPLPTGWAPRDFRSWVSLSTQYHPEQQNKSHFVARFLNGKMGNWILYGPFWFVGEFWLCFLVIFQPNMSAFDFLFFLG